MKYIAVAGEAEIAKEFDLEQTTRATMFEKAHGYIFKAGVIKKRGSTKCNFVAFDEYADGAYPPVCVVPTAKMILKDGKEGCNAVSQGGLRS